MYDLAWDTVQLVQDARALHTAALCMLSDTSKQQGVCLGLT